MPSVAKPGKQKVRDPSGGGVSKNSIDFADSAKKRLEIANPDEDEMGGDGEGNYD